MRFLPIIPVASDIYYNTRSILSKSIQNCYWAQAALPSKLLSVGDFSYYKEFCTVEINLPRKTGKTTALLEIAIEHFNRAIFISHSFDATRRFHELMGKLTSDRELTVTKYTAQKFEFINKFGETCNFIFGGMGGLNSLAGIQTEVVMVDNSFMLSDVKRDDIYNRFGHNMPKYKFFVFMG